MKTTRCKFQCSEVTKQTIWNKPGEFVYAAKFNAVSSGSPENDSFFAATPSGQISISTYKSDDFTPGKAYFIDISEVE